MRIRRWPATVSRDPRAMLHDVVQGWAAYVAATADLSVGRRLCTGMICKPGDRPGDGRHAASRLKVAWDLYHLSFGAFVFPVLCLQSFLDLDYKMED